MAKLRTIAAASSLGFMALGGGCQQQQPATTMQAQQLPAVAAINLYLDGFHFHSGDIDTQVEAHHLVTVLDEDVMQALIYDGNGEDAKLIGVEYIISQELFDTLPPDEKVLWHSHAYEVKSGQLIAPNLSPEVEHELMTKLVSTYGKTWHTWHTHRNAEVPTGIPTLMMAFTADGQIDDALLAERDQRFHVDSEEIAARRADIAAPEVDPLADAWEDGNVIVLERVNLGDEDD